MTASPVAPRDARDTYHQQTIAKLFQLATRKILFEWNRETKGPNRDSQAGCRHGFVARAAYVVERAAFRRVRFSERCSSSAAPKTASAEADPTKRTIAPRLPPAAMASGVCARDFTRLLYLPADIRGLRLGLWRQIRLGIEVDQLGLNVRRRKLGWRGGGNLQIR